jgi:hypothetical protein
VLILLGDHQPHNAVSGNEPDNEVPISIITRDPSVLAQISSWHWQNGLLPKPGAPLEPMDVFRDQFLNTFSTTAGSTAAGQAAPAPAQTAPTR